MEQHELLNRKIGNIDIPKLEAKEIEIQGMKVEEKGDKKQEILVLLCKHPDKDSIIEFTKIKVLRSDKAKVVGLWVQKDKEGNVQKGSALHELMKIAKVETLSELEGKKLMTTYQAEEGSYLCLKGY